MQTVCRPTASSFVDMDLDVLVDADTSALARLSCGCRAKQVDIHHHQQPSTGYQTQEQQQRSSLEQGCASNDDGSNGIDDVADDATATEANDQNDGSQRPATESIACSVIKSRVELELRESSMNQDHYQDDSLSKKPATPTTTLMSTTITTTATAGASTSAGAATQQFHSSGDNYHYIGNTGGGNYYPVHGQAHSSFVDQHNQPQLATVDANKNNNNVVSLADYQPTFISHAQGSSVQCQDQNHITQDNRQTHRQAQTHVHQHQQADHKHYQHRNQHQDQSAFYLQPQNEYILMELGDDHQWQQQQNHHQHQHQHQQLNNSVDPQQQHQFAQANNLNNDYGDGHFTLHALGTSSGESCAECSSHQSYVEDQQNNHQQHVIVNNVMYQTTGQDISSSGEYLAYPATSVNGDSTATNEFDWSAVLTYAADGADSATDQHQHQNHQYQFQQAYTTVQHEAPTYKLLDSSGNCNATLSAAAGSDDTSQVSVIQFRAPLQYQNQASTVSSFFDENECPTVTELTAVADDSRHHNQQYLDINGNSGSISNNDSILTVSNCSSSNGDSDCARNHSQNQNRLNGAGSALVGTRRSAGGGGCGKLGSISKPGMPCAQSTLERLRQFLLRKRQIQSRSSSKRYQFDSDATSVSSKFSEDDDADGDGDEEADKDKEEDDEEEEGDDNVQDSPGKKDCGDDSEDEDKASSSSSSSADLPALCVRRLRNRKVVVIGVGETSVATNSSDKTKSKFERKRKQRRLMATS